MKNEELLPLPTDADQLEACLADPMWRIMSGCLYKIKIKGDEWDDLSGDDVTFELPFKPNPAQLKFIERMWHRNIILKARQLGFTTLICILWLDHALFNANQNCAIIAQDLPTVFSVVGDLHFVLRLPGADHDTGAVRHAAQAYSKGSPCRAQRLVRLVQSTLRSAHEWLLGDEHSADRERWSHDAGIRRDRGGTGLHLYAPAVGVPAYRRPRLCND